MKTHFVCLANAKFGLVGRFRDVNTVISGFLGKHPAQQKSSFPAKRSHPKMSQASEAQFFTIYKYKYTIVYLRFRRVGD